MFQHSYLKKKENYIEFRTSTCLISSKIRFYFSLTFDGLTSYRNKFYVTPLNHCAAWFLSIFLIVFFFNPTLALHVFDFQIISRILHNLNELNVFCVCCPQIIDHIKRLLKIYRITEAIVWIIFQISINIFINMN